MTDLNTVLIVEDEKMFRQILREVLETEDFIVLEASKGQRSVEILKQHKVDTVLLDLHLPDAKGLEYIPAIRAHTNVPIIVVSGEEDDTIKINTLTQGADDFIAKPVDFKMLIAKINAHIRRHKEPSLQCASSPSSQANNNILTFEQWTFDTEKFQLFNADDRSADLTMREFLILKTLIDNAGNTVTRTDLCSAVQDNNYIPSNRAIDVKITRIRKKIGDDAVNSRMIKTIRGVGYAFSAPLKTAEKA